MKYDLVEFDKRVELGLIKKVENGPLVLYNYTDLCTFEKSWDEYTTIARGLIFEKQTGNVIGKSLPKFHNLNENEETQTNNLPWKAGYSVYDKMDGSLGIIYKYEGKWSVATRGSFTSDQALKAQEMLKKYEMEWVPEYITLLVEIIYPENKIIVDYKGETKLVLLTAYDRESCDEFNREYVEEFAQRMHMPIVDSHNLTLSDMLSAQKTMDKNKEGFVVRFNDGTRVKIKGDEYMRIARIISRLSPLSLWETMKNGLVDLDFLKELPEEFKEEYTNISKSLENKYFKTLDQIKDELNYLPTLETTKEGRKEIGLFLAKDQQIKHKSAMFSMLLNQKESVDKYIMKLIRPDGNVLTQ